MKIALNYLVIPLIAVITMAFGKFFTSAGMEWYETLMSPALKPPKWVFGAVWPLLYTLTTIAALLVWNTFERNTRFYAIISLFVTNAVLNALWCYFFFYKHAMFAALLDAIGLLATIIGLIVLIVPQAYTVALLLVPYAGWVTFAVYLNFQYIVLNYIG